MSLYLVQQLLNPESHRPITLGLLATLVDTEINHLKMPVGRMY